ncbi:DUF2577 family protein [Clostridium frigidicarnis]|uniref:Uncharacterized protein n=1 Tax=Clostridium frigidicarnis TaxID=84698 RepID=A0A1I0V159_9CLOT|nr:DUF2577 family protein [Clostridium frigidicarnis]SFA70055.1 Protein of unknown function [Clostridium frigidicarnis]
MTWSTEFAQEFKNRNNLSKIGAVVGTVLQINPIKIGILNNQVIISEDNPSTYICSGLIEKYAYMEIKKYTVGATASISTPNGGGSLSNITVDSKSDYDTKIKYKGLSIEDKVLVVCGEDNKTFFIVDKLVKGVI